MGAPRFHVGLIRRARRGASLELVYGFAQPLHADAEDLIQKAVGRALREAGKTDPARLERYLRANGPAIPRRRCDMPSKRFPDARRRALLKQTRYGR